MDEEDFCPKCGAYVEVDFDHYSEFDGRPIYKASCNCPEQASKSLATLGDFFKTEK